VGVDLVDPVDGRCGCAGNAFEDEDDDEYEDEHPPICYLLSAICHSRCKRALGVA
jgi:hypothetical protein